MAMMSPRQRGTGPGPIAFVIRTRSQAVSSDAVSAIVKRMIPSVPARDFGSVTDQVARSLYRDGTMASPSILFAGPSAFLCVMEVFGLTRFSAGRATSEIAIRLALGARRSSAGWS